MQTLIHNYKTAMKPSDFISLVGIETSFEKINFEEHHSLPSDLETIPNNDIHLQVELLINTYEEKCDDIITSMGIRYVGNVMTLTEKQELLETLLEIENPENLDIIQANDEAYRDDEPDVYLCNLLAEMSDLTFIHYRYVIEEVERALILSIRKLIPNEAVHGEVLNETRNVKRLYIKTAKDYKGAVHSVIVNAATLPLGFNKTLVAISEKLDELKNPEIAKELLLLLIATATPIDDMVNKASVFIEENFDSGKHLSINSNFMTLFKELENEES